MEFTKAGAEAFLKKLTELINANLTDEQFGVSKLAQEMGMSRSNLHRKVKSQTGISVSQYVCNIRLDKATELLKETSLSISDVATKSGFHSVTYFTKCFKDRYGYPPGMARKNETSDAGPNAIHQNLVNPGRGKNRSTLVWILATLVFVISAAFLFHLFAPLAGKQNIQEKTIAVLPIRNDSPDKDNAYIINGFMEEILHKLTLIEDLKVVSRTSVEKYRDSDESIIEIGKELNVNFILEGSAQTIQGKTKIHLQLIDAHTDKHLWSQPYKQNLSLDNMFEMQEEVALAVANELELVLASGEKEQLEQIPTKNIAAYNLYLLGKELLNIHLYNADNNGREKALLDAKQCFEQAIELDSTFADAYTLLGSIYIVKLYYSKFEDDLDLATSYLDSGLILLDKALLYDKNSPEALGTKAAYYEIKGMHEEANRIYETLAKKGPLPFEAAVSRYYNIEDYYNAIESYLRYLQSKPEDIIVPPYLLRTMIRTFRKTGFPELEKQLAKQLLYFNNDSMLYLNELVLLENWQGNFPDALFYGLEAWKLDSTDSNCNLLLGLNYAYQDDYTNALKHIRIYENTMSQLRGDIQPIGFAGYIYMMNGKKKEADFHFHGVISKWRKEFELNTPAAQTFISHHELADVYLALGEKEKALEYLKVYKTLQTIDLVHITTLNSWPGFDIIRDDPEFLDIMRVIEATYQKEHNRIEKLLIREGMIKS